jgi:hypothetical protein
VFDGSLDLFLCRVDRLQTADSWMGRREGEGPVTAVGDLELRYSRHTLRPLWVYIEWSLAEWSVEHVATVFSLFTAAARRSFARSFYLSGILLVIPINLTPLTLLPQYLELSWYKNRFRISALLQQLFKTLVAGG